MRTRLFCFSLSAIAVLMLLSLAPAWAGTAPTLTFTLSEPVVAGGSTLPAGEYTAHILDTIGDTPVLMLEGRDGPRVMIQVRRAGLRHGDESPHASFVRQDGVLRFRDVQFAGEPFCYEVLSH